MRVEEQAFAEAIEAFSLGRSRNVVILAYQRSTRETNVY